MPLCFFRGAKIAAPNCLDEETMNPYWRNEPVYPIDSVLNQFPLNSDCALLARFYAACSRADLEAGFGI
jgi:hypothetical protein